MSYFKSVTPESVGIESKGILNFIHDVRRKGIEQHSLMVIRHGKCCAQGWWKPYGPEYLHPVYSFSKSLTATAIGFAEQEGILSLDERLVDIFADQLPDEVSDNLKEVTLEHLLTMSCGHETEIEDKETEGWVRMFLAHPFLHKPGTFYKYNTAGTNMLAAVLKVKTGEDITEFLRPRLLDPLGIKEIYCARTPGKDGVEHGGGGMKLRTEDMAKFTYFLLHRGAWEGRQLLREAWFDRACVKQIETLHDSENHTGDWGMGYGYQCWMGTVPGSFRVDGAYGQFGLVYPSLDLIVVMTTATEQTQTLLSSLAKYLLPAVKEQQLPESIESTSLKGELERLALPMVHGDRCPYLEEKLDAQVYEAQKEENQGCCSMEYLIGGAGIFDLYAGEIDKMAFYFAEDTMQWSVWEDGEIRKITASFTGEAAVSETNGITYAATACWRSLGALELEVRRVDAISGSRIVFRFEGDGLRIESDDTLVSVGGLGLHQKHVTRFRTFGQK